MFDPFSAKLLFIFRCSKIGKKSEGNNILTNDCPHFFFANFTATKDEKYFNQGFFSCTIFWKLMILNLFVFISSEEKPFVCNMCGHRFNKKSNMVKHVKMVHEKLRPWTCEECNKSFSDRRDLVAHEDSVHKGLKPFDCPYCDYKCARKKNM